MNVSTISMRRGIFLLLTTLFIFSAYSRQISPQEAAAFATDFFNKDFSAHQTAKRVIINASSELSITDDNAEQPYYIFNNGDNKGFVIIAGDDRVSPILGYSDSGCFSSDNQPPQLTGILQAFAKGLEELPASAPAHPSWTSPGNSVLANRGKVLKTVCWGQGAPYNLRCPNNAPAGCVATAMAIVMRYHNWPETGRNRHKINAKRFLDFSKVNFNWELMENPGTQEWTQEGADEVAKLLKNLGTAIDMTYSASGSGASDALVGRYLFDYFKYSAECQTIHRHSFSDSEWNDLIVNEIDNDRPVIYGGYSATEGGHEFVVDGYEHGMYHVNWGWDGYSNGFFDINELLGFNLSQSMVININPDKEDTDFEKYSRLFVDKCYQTTIGPVYEPCGVNISTENIVAGEPFYLSVGQLEVIDEEFNCGLALAIVDENDNIKGYIYNVGDPITEDLHPSKEAFTYFFTDATGGMAYGDIYEEYMSDNNNIYSEIQPMKVFTDCSDICPTDRLQLMARRIADVIPGEPYEDYSFIEDRWKIVAGTKETPTSIPVSGWKPVGATLSWSLSDGVELMAPSGVPENFAMRNSCNEFWLLHGNGLCRAFVNGVPTALHPNSKGSSLQIYPIEDHYDITVDFIPIEKADKLNVNVTTPGTLSDVLQGKDLTKIVELTVSGKIDMRDLVFIKNNLPYLVTLDLGNTDICAFDKWEANSICSLDGITSTINSATLTNLVLPNTLEHIGENAIFCDNLYAIKLPSSLKKMDGLFENFLYQNNALSSNHLRSVLVDTVVPFEMDEGGIYVATHGRVDMDAYPTTLIVPTGAKQAYSNAQGWKDFTEIIELDKPACGDRIIDGVRFVAVGDHAEVRSSYFFDLPEHMVIPDSVSFDGVKVPVTYVGVWSIEGIYGRDYPHARYITFGENIKYIDSGSIYSAGEIIYALCDGVIHYLHSRYVDGVNHKYDYYYPYLYPKALPGYYYEDTYNLYCPGGVACKDDILLAAMHEMWNYNLDSKNGIVRIAPVIDGLVFDEIVINGEKQPVSSTNFYYFSPGTESLDIVVNYNLHHRQSMSTHYTPEFNSTYAQSDFSGIESIEFGNRPQNLRVYTLTGIKLLQDASEKDIDSLVPGLYIITDGIHTKKVAIE